MGIEGKHASTCIPGAIYQPPGQYIQVYGEQGYMHRSVYMQHCIVVLSRDDPVCCFTDTDLAATMISLIPIVCIKYPIAPRKVCAI